MTTLDLDRVSYRYRHAGEDALREVSVSFRSGELVSVVGQNGSGKSTLLKILARVSTPGAGRVRLDDKPVDHWPAKEYAKRIGYLPQEIDPVFPMRAIDVVLSGRAPHLGRFEWESLDDEARARAALEECDASHLADRDLDQMSGGERKRVFLARALAGSPEVILLDEPLAALDLAHVHDFVALLRGLATSRGTCVIFVSHDLNWAAAYADRMLVLHGGRLVLDAPPSAVMTAEAMRRYFEIDATPVSANGRAWILPPEIGVP